MQEKRTFKAPKTVSLKKELSATAQNGSGDEISENTQKPAEETPKQPTEQKSDDSAFNTDIKSIWQEIADSIKDEGPRINAAIQQANPRQKDDNTIEIQISAEQQKELYDKYQAKILEVLRTKTGNKNLKFEFIVNDTQIANNRPKTYAEQYQELSEKNPALELLRQKFNLDVKK